MFPYLIGIICSSSTRFEFQLKFDCNGKPSNKHLHRFTIVKLNFQRLQAFDIFDIRLTLTFIYYLLSTIEMRFIEDGFPINILVDFTKFYYFDHVRYLLYTRRDAKCLMHGALCLMRMFVKVLLCHPSHSLTYSSSRMVQTSKEMLYRKL